MAADYELDTRKMLENLERDVKDDMKYIINKVDDLSTKVTNHLMHRLPTWATMYISFLSIIVGGLLFKVIF